MYLEKHKQIIENNFEILLHISYILTLNTYNVCNDHFHYIFMRFVKTLCHYMSILSAFYQIILFFFSINVCVLDCALSDQGYFPWQLFKKWRVLYTTLMPGSQFCCVFFSLFFMSVVFMCGAKLALRTGISVV